MHALLGGCLIGLAATIVLLAQGRIAGICGIVARALEDDGARSFRLPFLLGLVAVGVVAARLTPTSFGAAVHGTPVLAAAGLLVGIGTTIANGCTSGHGVCGISRGSKRSLIATVTFMVAGAITVAIVGAVT